MKGCLFFIISVILLVTAFMVYEYFTEIFWFVTELTKWVTCYETSNFLTENLKHATNEPKLW